jgi:hypothetical protein
VSPSNTQLRPNGETDTFIAQRFDLPVEGITYSCSWKAGVEGEKMFPKPWYSPESAVRAKSSVAIVPVDTGLKA